MKSIYLANPYGFSAQQKALLLPPIINAIERHGIQVLEPFARNQQVDFASPNWARVIGQADVNDVIAADAIFAICNGTPPDEGVMVELGMAIALGKPTFLFRDDFRRCTDSDCFPMNLMLFTGMPGNWKDHYYTSVESIAEDRGLAVWSRS